MEELRAIRSGRPSPDTSPGEVTMSYWFQPLPSEVCPRMVRYTRSSPPAFARYAAVWLAWKAGYEVCPRT
ncbi:hypothetical protein TN53_12860 [Streptomyces sp. WM6386]|nr:hypothetical protein TN53_12860 [Streptomyces sp. WM6386]KKD15192.1 hypothetical protein TR66_11925 [Streptomyces sp. WM6391]